MKPFENVNVVSLVAHVLGIEARPNNGTIEIFRPALSSEDNHNSGSTSSFLVCCTETKILKLIIMIIGLILIFQ